MKKLMLSAVAALIIGVTTMFFTSPSFAEGAYENYISVTGFDESTNSLQQCGLMTYQLPEYYHESSKNTLESSYYYLCFGSTVGSIRAANIRVKYETASFKQNAFGKYQDYAIQQLIESGRLLEYTPNLTISGKPAFSFIRSFTDVVDNRDTFVKTYFIFDPDTSFVYHATCTEYADQEIDFFADFDKTIESCVFYSPENQ